jgi:hypothetical protein
MVHTVHTWSPLPARGPVVRDWGVAATTLQGFWEGFLELSDGDVKLAEIMR